MPVVREMLAEHLNSVIRGLNNGEVGRAKSIRSATFAALKRLGAKRDLRRAVRKVPKGSDQFDVGSIVVWLSRIGKDDAKAIDQVIVIDATATVRVKG